jgi:hypothetical protein
VLLVMAAVALIGAYSTGVIDRTQSARGDTAPRRLPS